MGRWKQTLFILWYIKCWLNKWIYLYNDIEKRNILIWALYMHLPKGFVLFVGFTSCLCKEGDLWQFLYSFKSSCIHNSSQQTPDFTTVYCNIALFEDSVNDQRWFFENFLLPPTKWYGLLRKPTTSSCKRLWASTMGLFALQAKSVVVYAVVALLWPFCNP